MVESGSWQRIETYSWSYFQKLWLVMQATNDIRLARNKSAQSCNNTTLCNKEEINLWSCGSSKWLTWTSSWKSAVIFELSLLRVWRIYWRSAYLPMIVVLAFPFPPLGKERLKNDDQWLLEVAMMEDLTLYQLAYSRSVWLRDGLWKILAALDEAHLMLVVPCHRCHESSIVAFFGRIGVLNVCKGLVTM